MRLIWAAGKEQNMKNTLVVRSRHLVVLVILSAGSLFADSSSMTLYPGWGTTLNDKAVYFSVLLQPGYRVQTERVMSKMTVGAAELDISPNTTVVLGEPISLICGTLTVRSGTVEISDGKTSTSITPGQSVHSKTCGNALPDAPSAVRIVEDARYQQAAGRFKRAPLSAQLAGTRGTYIDPEVANWSYWTVNGVMLGSSVAAVELTQKCITAGNCGAIPSVFRRRIAMYGVGLPAEVGVSYFGYYLKRNGKRWWFVPEAAVIAGDLVVATHAAHYSH
jgi:hypothetical protein